MCVIWRSGPVLLTLTRCLTLCLLYLMRLGTQEMLGVVEVKGEATDASSSDREIPLCALFRA